MSRGGVSQSVLVLGHMSPDELKKNSDRLVAATAKLERVFERDESPSREGIGRGRYSAISRSRSPRTRKIDETSMNRAKASHL